MESIYRILNRETKNWWYHRQLRKEGNETEARKRERDSIKHGIEMLRDVIQHGGYLSLGRRGWSVNVFTHETSENSSQSYSLQGYYNLNNECYFETIFKRLGLPIVYTRDLPLNVALSLFIRNYDDLINFFKRGSK